MVGARMSLWRLDVALIVVTVSVIGIPVVSRRYSVVHLRGEGSRGTGPPQTQIYIFLKYTVNTFFSKNKNSTF